MKPANDRRPAANAPSEPRRAVPDRRRTLRALGVLAALALIVVWTAVAAGAADGRADPARGAEAPQARADGGSMREPASDRLEAPADRELERSEPATPEPTATLPEPTDQPAAAGQTDPRQASAEEQPACTYADDPAPLGTVDQWQYTVLDTRFRLASDYAPDDLVELAVALADVAPGAAPAGMTLRAVVLPDLRELLTAADAAGVALAVQSAYRSFAYQESTFAYWVKEDGYDQALRSSARAGHSEHQLGTAMDLRSLAGPEPWDLDDWATTPEGAWVAENAWRYGFVMSYPPGKEGVTCYMYEPWHYRYVGRELAADVRASGLTLREYLLNRSVADGR
ncbi:MAG: M15 family metallopeptidase [Trueperaceae bacterium]|nr:M15 family metallopeptidase [Trueperaceae bacterium]MCO5174061.1 M15 family metallopeptidase [Trueperaceae bacterium]